MRSLSPSLRMVVENFRSLRSGGPPGARQPSSTRILASAAAAGSAVSIKPRCTSEIRTRRSNPAIAGVASVLAATMSTITAARDKHAMAYVGELRERDGRAEGGRRGGARGLLCFVSRELSGSRWCLLMLSPPALRVAPRDAMSGHRCRCSWPGLLREKVSSSLSTQTAAEVSCNGGMMDLVTWERAPVLPGVNMFGRHCRCMRSPTEPASQSNGEQWRHGQQWARQSAVFCHI